MIRFTIAIVIITISIPIFSTYYIKLHTTLTAKYRYNTYFAQNNKNLVLYNSIKVSSTTPHTNVFTTVSDTATFIERVTQLAPQLQIINLTLTERLSLDVDSVNLKLSKESSTPPKSMNDLKSVFGRYVNLKSGTKLQLTYRYKTNDQVKNYAFCDIHIVLEQLLSQVFKKAVVFHNNVDILTTATNCTRAKSIVTLVLKNERLQDGEGGRKQVHAHAPPHPRSRGAHWGGERKMRKDDFILSCCFTSMLPLPICTQTLPPSSPPAHIFKHPPSLPT